VYLWSAF